MGVFPVIAHRLLKLRGDWFSTKTLVAGVNVILGLLLGYQVMALMGVVGDPHALALPIVGPKVQPRAVSEPHKVDAIAPEQLHLFGEPQMVARQETVAAAPEIRPQLTLRGIIHSTNSRAARAIITESDGRDVAYPLGARLPGGRRLTKINYRDVVVSHQGREELLPLAKKVTPES